MASDDPLPTLYEYYTSGDITSGLVADGETFTLNNRGILILGGALHYFRVPQEYWKDRLRKMRAAGLNTLETYVPWNLHEPSPGNYYFGPEKDESPLQRYLDVKLFLQTAQDEDLFVILRPGPYICAELDLGGLPSWLLRHDDIKLRCSHRIYMRYVHMYYRELFNVIVPFQFSKGGPIIAFQIENEYGNVNVANKPVDKKYLNSLKEIMTDNGVEELLFTSDTPSNGFSGCISRVLATANFQVDARMELGLLKVFQPDKALMAMEFWTGWFDHWSSRHETRSSDLFKKTLEEILKMNASINMYMFHGGTTWGFLNGANLFDGKYEPDTTSYDYDAPLSEQGNYTAKYQITKALIEKYNPVKTVLPGMPEETKTVTYPCLNVKSRLSFTSVIDNLASFNHENLIAFEKVFYNTCGFGYVVYRRKKLNIPAKSNLMITAKVRDCVMVLINGKLVSPILRSKDDLHDFGYWCSKENLLNLGNVAYERATLDLVVENWGLVNYGTLEELSQQRKGLYDGYVYLNNKPLSGWYIYHYCGTEHTTNSTINGAIFGANLTTNESKLKAQPTESGGGTNPLFGKTGLFTSSDSSILVNQSVFGSNPNNSSQTISSKSQHGFQFQVTQPALSLGTTVNSMSFSSSPFVIPASENTSADKVPVNKTEREEMPAFEFLSSDSFGPAIFQAQLVLTDEPCDTFLDMRYWMKGVVSINGFCIGRYCHLGPQQTLYVPAPFLKRGRNDIEIFEHFAADTMLRFSKKPIWDSPDR